MRMACVCVCTCVIFSLCICGVTWSRLFPIVGERQIFLYHFTRCCRACSILTCMHQRCLAITVTRTVCKFGASNTGCPTSGILTLLPSDELVARLAVNLGLATRATCTPLAPCGQVAPCGQCFLMPRCLARHRNIHHSRCHLQASGFFLTLKCSHYRSRCRTGGT